MNFKLLVDKHTEKVYDGSEEGYYQTNLNYNLPKLPQITMGDLRAFFKFKDDLGVENMNRIVSMINGVKKDEFFPNLYTSMSSYALYYTIVPYEEGKAVLIASGGEKQPGRYQVFLEGAWKIEE